MISDHFMRNCIGEHESSLAVESWESEGWHFPGPRGVATQPINASQSIGNAAAAPENLGAMRARFRFDFSHGLMGERHNTFQHRSRMLHQAEARAALRDRSFPPASPPTKPRNI